MRILKDFELLFQQELTSIYDKDEVKALFLFTVEEMFGLKRGTYPLKKEDIVTEKDAERFDEILRELKKNKPIQYIFNKATFYGESFEVNESVLIPRPETEELVDLILKQHSAQAGLHIMDIGTGSGCIPIILSKYLPGAQVTSMDISKEAIATARKNAGQLNAPVQFINADIFEWDYIFSEQQYDIIVSNPPYITPQEKASMQQNVLAFEPELALFIEDSAPLIFYDVISSFALKHLAPQGDLYFEINQYLGPQTKELIEKKGFRPVKLLKDINGADRMIHAKKST
ncbi:peptide chain release factor N(5)-glutamine methyltransferase [Sphingobacterium thalpophilum]|uniref:peptide chain release factor N(5)-glutamine methyltransferase n=1 Tax=Sphingobacterium thalpophilum TaxID=259 RepID=A0A4U9W652_9SPHI|nr:MULTISPECIES: peptide chain release factor N(5)-glutamine methyltransferase [Sphingobacterium]MCW8314153.1 peptide chain release factor N(5)-glutamine methyltransferase [Sphingobacterium sp. InxBP1]VTR54291.1 Release factor glutamine methyltransferase [Sphingobacterium thalpophilum]